MNFLLQNPALIPGFQGPGEVLLVFLAILLLFGGKKLPGLARSLGRSLSEFKKGKEEGAKDALPATDADREDKDKEAGAER